MFSGRKGLSREDEAEGLNKLLMGMVSIRPNLAKIGHSKFSLREPRTFCRTNINIGRQNFMFAWTIYLYPKSASSYGQMRAHWDHLAVSRPSDRGHRPDTDRIQIYLRRARTTECKYQSLASSTNCDAKLFPRVGSHSWIAAGLIRFNESSARKI